MQMDLTTARTQLYPVKSQPRGKLPGAQPTVLLLPILVDHTAKEPGVARRLTVGLCLSLS